MSLMPVLSPVLSRSRLTLLPGAAPAVAALALTALTAPAANAQASLAFSGGNGTPLTISILSPVTYTITTASASGPFFVFDAVGNPFANGSAASATGTGTLTFSINNGAPRTINTGRSGVTAGALTADDLYFFNNQNASSAFAVGDQVVLSAGTFTTTSAVARPAPTSGSYASFLINTNGTSISSNGVSTAAAAPEPGTIALLLTAGIPVVSIVRRRKAIGKK